MEYGIEEKGRKCEIEVENSKIESRRGRKRRGEY